MGQGEGKQHQQHDRSIIALGAKSAMWAASGSNGWKAATRTPWSAVIPLERVFARTATVSNDCG
jgi:hypothetical protein